MKKYVFKLFIFFLFFLGSTSKSEFYDVGIFFDTSEVMAKNTDLAVTLDMYLPFCQRKFSLIVTSNLFRTFIDLQFRRNPAGVGPEDSIARILKYFKDEFYDLYKTKKGDFYVLIPKDLTKTNIPFEFKNLEKLSFDQFTMKVNSPQEKKRLLEMVLNLPLYNWFDIESFKQIFMQDKGLWNMLVIGHGLFPKLLTNLNKDVKFFEQFDLYDAQIVGLNFPDYLKFLNFLVNNIQLNFLYQTSCFAGDYNLILPYLPSIMLFGVLKPLTKLPNFTVAVGSITSQVTYATNYNSIHNCVDNKPLSENDYNFVKMFENLRKFGTGGVIKYKTEELSEILKPVSFIISKEDPNGILSTPSVMLPGTERFVAVPVTKNLIVLSDALYKIQLQRAQNFDFNNIRGLLIYPPEINLEININSAPDKIPTMVSMLPGVNLHKFKKVNLNFTFEQFIKSFIGGTKPVFEKYFYFDELSLMNDRFPVEGDVDKKVTLRNVLVRLKEDSIKVIFIKDGHVYSNEISKGFELKKPSLKYDYQTQKYVDNEFVNAIINFFFKGNKNDNAALREKMSFDTLVQLISKEDSEELNKFRGK